MIAFSVSRSYVSFMENPKKPETEHAVTRLADGTEVSAYEPDKESDQDLFDILMDAASAGAVMGVACIDRESGEGHIILCVPSNTGNPIPIARLLNHAERERLRPVKHDGTLHDVDPAEPMMKHFRAVRENAQREPSDESNAVSAAIAKLLSNLARAAQGAPSVQKPDGKPHLVN